MHEYSWTPTTRRSFAITWSWTMTIGWLVSKPITIWVYGILKILLDEILHAILPEELTDGAPAGFAATGHIGEILSSSPRPFGS
jgi:hypothetical protein